MIDKLLILTSILFSTLGFNNLALDVDKNILSRNAGHEKTAEASDSSLTLPEIIIPPTIKEDAKSENIYAKRYLLVDLETDTILAKKAYKEKVPIASTTKIMTAIVALENYNLDDVVTISNNAANQIGATANFYTGEKLTVYDLLKCLLIKSANGAADALAEYMNTKNEVGKDKFVKAMNQKAKELEMNDTEYHDPAGLDTTGWSTTYDLYLATKYALKNDIFAEIVKIKETTVTDITKSYRHSLTNSNRLVGEWDYPGAIGVKTGYMPEAGHCLVAAASRDGHTLVSVVLFTNADTATASAEESRKLLNWGFENTEWHN